MQALAARRLAEGHEVQFPQPRGDLAGARDHRIEADIGRRIEIEDQAARQFGIAGLAVPRMQLRRPHLGHGDQAFDAVDLEIGFLVAAHFHFRQEVRGSGHGVTLEEVLLAVDPVGRAHNGAGPSGDMIDHPVAHRLVIAREFDLGDRRLLVGPQRLVGMRDRHAHDDRRTRGLRLRLACARAGLAGHRLCHLDLLRLRGHFRLDLLGRLVAAQPLKGSLTDIARAGPPGELDLGHQVGPRPMHVGFLGRARARGEGAGLALDLAQLRDEGAHHALAEAGADAADIDELPALALAAMDARKQRPQTPAFAGPAADDHLVARPAFGLGPAAAATRSIGRIELFRHDPFEVHAAGRLQHGIARRLEVIDEAQAGVFVFHPLEQCLEASLAFRQRQGTQIFGLKEQKVEREEDEVFRLVFRKRRLKRREVRCALLVERHRLTVEDAVRQRLSLPGDGRELPGPVEALAGAKLSLAILDAKLQAIAVELHLMRPACRGRRSLDQLGQLRLDERRHRGDRPDRRLGLAFHFRFSLRGHSGLAAVLLVALPDGAGAALLAGHEGLGRFAGAQPDFLQGASGGDRFGIFQDLVVVALVRGGVAMLDQQPVGALAALAVPLHAHQHPAPLEPLAHQAELEIAALQPVMRIALGNPVAAIPELDGASTILPLGDRAFEVTIVERMVLDLDGQPLDRRIERRAFGHRPRLERAIELEAKIVVESRRVVTLNDETKLPGFRNGGLARRLFRQAEVALGAIGSETILAHEPPISRTLPGPERRTPSVVAIRPRLHLPMQKSRKITSSSSSRRTVPVMRPRARSASRRSSAASATSGA